MCFFIYDTAIIWGQTLANKGKVKIDSFFCFGARGVGKTSYISSEFVANQSSIFIDLLDPDEFDRFILKPSELTQRIDGFQRELDWVVIDEIQKIPPLLDLVHKIIEERGIKFALSGSSSRKLKRGRANLLAGRAFTYEMYPLTSLELGEAFNLHAALEFGTLPKMLILDSDERKKLFLRTYVQTYLKEEIAVEQVVRQLEPFRKFLNIAAQSSGEIVNYANIGRDVGVSNHTVRSYFEILEDTLIGVMLEPYDGSIRKRLCSNPKFYFFDLGVRRALSRHLALPLAEKTYEYGNLFEQFIFLELKRLSHYFRNDFLYSYLQTKDHAEIDLIVERPGMPTALVEITSTSFIRDEHVRGLAALARDFDNSESYCLSLDTHAKKIDKVTCLHWQDGIKAILGI